MPAGTPIVAAELGTYTVPTRTFGIERPESDGTSSHTAPALHASLDAALPHVVNAEYFHDHVIIEEAFFDGLPTLVNGELVPDRGAPGHGLTLKREDAYPYLTEEWRSS